MNCKEFKARLHDYFLERLPVEASHRLDEHAAGCPDCGALMSTARELSCHDFIEFLNDFLEDELDPERREVFERHLAICPDCTNYLDSYRKTMRLTVFALAEGEPSVPQDVPEELILGVLDSLGMPDGEDE